MTEDVRFIAVFLLADRPVPAASDGESAATLLAAAVPGLVRRTDTASGSALLTPERPSGTARMAPFLLEGAVDRDGLSVQVLVGHLGAAALIVSAEVAPGDVRRTELALEPRLDGLVHEVSAASGRLRLVGLAAPWEPEAMPAGRLLWWHRLVLADRDPSDVHPKLRYAVPVEDSADGVGVVAQGFTVLRTMHRDEVDEGIRGLFAATEEWLLVDELTRRLGGWVRAVDGLDAALSHTLSDVRSASIDLIARRSMLEERARYLDDLARAVRIAARTAWGVDEEFRLMAERLVEMRKLVDDERSIRQAVRDARRNELLFVFTLLAVLQTVLVLFDFATNANEQIVSLVRIVVAAGVAIVGASLIARAIRETRLRREDAATRGAQTGADRR